MAGNSNTFTNKADSNISEGEAAAAQASHAAGNLARDQMEKTNETVRSGLNFAMGAAEKSLSRFGDAFSGDKAKEAMKQSSRHMEAISGAGTELSQGLQDMSREWMSWAKSGAEKSRNAMGALVQCRSPQELFEVQSRLVKENIELLVVSTQKISEIATDVAKKASQKITAI